MFWILRTTGDPMSLATGLAVEVRRIDPEVVAAQIRPMDHYLSDAVAPRRFSLSLITAFAAAALALAITGIYAVVMYSVSQRAREIGIRARCQPLEHRTARYAPRHSLYPHRPCIGNRNGVGVTRLLSTMLFGLAATDAVTFGQVAVVVAAVPVLACAVPAARVGRLVVSVLKAE